jgi:GT2 family glycosyltransferase
VIGVVILRFNGAKAELQRAVQSLMSSSVSGQIVDVLLLDNCSPNHREIVDEVAAQYGAPVRSSHLPRNFGFSGGVNRGITMLDPRCDFVMLLNDDAWVEPSAIERLVQALQNASPSVISSVPKILLGSWGPHGAALMDTSVPLLESVGVCVNEKGEAKNVGLGQPDLGQFDQPAPSLGPSFGVAMFRRSAFALNSVGPLNESYFLYYEDVEWNWRAWRLGFQSVTVPTARAHHMMSASSRADHQGTDDQDPDNQGSDNQDADHLRTKQQDQAYSSKHRYIERNLLLTATTHLPAHAAWKLWLTRWPRLIKGRVTGRFPKASLTAACESAVRLPSAIRTRRSISGRSSDVALDAVFVFWKPEQIFFDPVTYKPEYSWEALRVAAQAAGLITLAEAANARNESLARIAIDSLSERPRRVANSYVDLLLR